MHREQLHVEIAPTTQDGDGDAAIHGRRRLLTMIATDDAGAEAGDGRRFTDVMLYLHGFPDLAVHPTQLAMASRMPLKLAESWLQHSRQLHQQRDVAFVAFNFAGVPGSDAELCFHDKTIGLEVEDAVGMCRYIRGRMLADGGRIHVVGLSTGAIIASLLRGKDVAQSISVIAGLVDLPTGILYDFDAQQRQQFEDTQACWKEFYLPEGCSLPSNTGISLDGVQEASTEDLQALEAVPRKLFLLLHRQYLDECLSGALDIQQAVAAVTTGLRSPPPPPPLLVIHGDADQQVPFSDGLALFQAAAEPKRFVAIAKGNHLLTNSKHLKKAVKAIMEHIALEQGVYRAVD